MGSDGIDGLFRHSLPVFSSAYGTAPTGMLQIYLATSLLSHYLNGYSLFSAWLLCCVGALNVSIGLIFGRDGKLRRSFKRTRRDEYAEKRAKQKGKGGSIVSCMAKLSKTGIADIGKRMKRQSGQMLKKDHKKNEEETLLPRYNSNTQARAIPTAFDAFKGRSTYGVGVPRSTRSGRAHERQISSSTVLGAPTCNHDEVLRWRARQENNRVEKLTEGIEYASSCARTTSLRTEMRKLSVELDLNIEQLKQEQESTVKLARSPRRKPFKRRTLVLSKMVANVKRRSVNAATAARSHVHAIRSTTRRPTVPLPPMPGAYRREDGSVRRGLPSNDRTTVWSEVESNDGPSINRQFIFPPPRTHKATGPYAKRSHCETQYHLPMTIRGIQ
jgi:hypothetical protein